MRWRGTPLPAYCHVGMDVREDWLLCVFIFVSMILRRDQNYDAERVRNESMA